VSSQQRSTLRARNVTVAYLSAKSLQNIQPMKQNCHETILLQLSMGDKGDLLTALLQAQISLQATIKKQQDIWYHSLG